MKANIKKTIMIIAIALLSIAFILTIYAYSLSVEEMNKRRSTIIDYCKNDREYIDLTIDVSEHADRWDKKELAKNLEQQHKNNDEHNKLLPKMEGWWKN